MTSTIMKAIRMHAPDSPSHLHYEDVPKPRIQPNEILIKVHAAAVSKQEIITWNIWKNRDGSERKLPIPGHDISGVVEEIGNSVTGDISIGDEVYGLTTFDRDGGMAEYTVALPEEITRKPVTLDHIYSSVIPISALTAWQALYVHAGLQKGHRILITGGSGAVGLMAVQLAKWTGAIVFSVGSTKNIELLKKMGSDEVCDYTTTKFEDVFEKVDVVLDCVGGDTLFRCWGMVKDGGVLISVAEPPLGNEGLKEKYPKVKPVWFIVEPSGEQLVKIRDLVDNGVLKVIIDRVMPLQEGRTAFEIDHTRGKIVLKVAKD